MAALGVYVILVVLITIMIVIVVIVVLVRRWYVWGLWVYGSIFRVQEFISFRAYLSRLGLRVY